MGETTVQQCDPPHDMAHPVLPQQSQPDLCLQSPIETLLASAEDPEGLHIFDHDVIEAYSLFSNRIKANPHFMTDDTLVLPFLKQHSTTVIDVIQRDIRRIFYHPTSTDDEESDNVRNSISLCHEALRLLSDILSAPSLYTCFDSRTLSSIMSLVLSLTGLGSSSDIPPLCRPATIWMTIWLLKVQRLDMDVLLPVRDELIFVLRRCVQGDAGMNKVLLDALQAVENLLHRHPIHFVDHISHTTPHLLQYAISTDPGLRANAVGVLGAFAHAKLQGAISTPVTEQLSEHVLTFMDPKPDAGYSLKEILTMLSDAVILPDLSQTGCGPVWALALIAAIVVLSDGPIFYAPRAIKTLIPPLGTSLGHGSSVVHSLHAHVWNCWTWAFGHIHVPSSRAKGDPKVKKDQAFQFLAQDLRPSNGSALVTRLFSLPPEISDSNDRVGKIMEVVRRMVQSRSVPVRSEGVSLLDRVLGTSPSSSPVHQHWCPIPFLPKSLFDGTILRAQYGRLVAVVLASLQPDGYLVPTFTEEQIVAHWDELLELWTSAAHGVLGNSVTNDASQIYLIHSWQTLLLARTQFTQGLTHFTTDISSQQGVRRTVSDLITVPPSSPNLDIRLKLGSSLVSVMRNVFTSRCIEEMAEAILRRLLEQHYDLTDENVQGAWSQLCLGLLSASGERAVETIASATEVQTRRRLWGLLSDIWKSASGTIGWPAMVRLLVISVGSWTMSPSELELWDENLRTAVAVAASHDVNSAAVVHQFLQEIGEQRLEFLADIPQVVVALLSNLDVAHKESFSAQFLRLVNSTLCKLYPPNPDLLPTSLRLLPLVHQLLGAAGQSSELSSLMELRSSLCLWVADAKTALSVEQYNQSVIPIYVTSLELLKACAPSEDILRDFSDLFVAAFTRAPPPALGPMAFASYWRATFLGREEFLPLYPTSLKQCLKAFDDVVGVGLAVGLSIDSSSDQSATALSVVPSSQSPYGKALDHEPFLHADPTLRTPQAQQQRADAFGLSPGSDNPFIVAPGPSNSKKVHPSNALLELAQYSSQTQEHSSAQGLPGTSRSSNQILPRRSSSMSQGKRFATPLGHPAKRRKVSSEAEAEEGASLSPTSPQGFRSDDAPVEDFDSWEVGMSSQDISAIQQELSNLDDPDDGLQGTQVSESTQIVQDDDDQEANDNSLVVPSPIIHHHHHHARDRSQTEPPELDPTSPRRHIPLKRNRTTSSKLEIIQRAHSIMHSADEGDSQTPMEDFIRAKALVDQMGAALNEKINKKLGKLNQKAPRG